MIRKDVLQELTIVGLQISEAVAQQDTARAEHLKRRSCLEPQNYESRSYKAIDTVETMMRHDKVRRDWTKIKAANRSKKAAMGPSIEIPEHIGSVEEMWDLIKTMRTPARDLK